MKKIVIDIDGTICTNTDGDYENAKPIYDRINKINSLHQEGNVIVFFTARGMGRTGDDAEKAKEMFYELTKKQLDMWNVKYNKLVLGKVSGDLYVDDKGIRDEEFFRN